MKYTKPSIPITQQVAKLKSRGLTFKDEAYAQAMLSRISFYRLRAYTYPFQDNTNPAHPFNVPIDFETIIKLYKFDRKLRLLIFGALEKIEIALRTQIIYQYSLQHGSHWHIEQNLYFDKSRAISQLGKLQKEVNRSDETFIKHYKATYTSPADPPCWMSLEVASFGTLSMLFRNLRNGSEKNAVATSFGLPNTTTLQNWMHNFAHIRNICAHHGRLWNRRLTVQPKLPYNTQHTFLTKAEARALHTNKLYASLCSIKYMLDRIESDFNFSRKLKKLLDKCPMGQENDMGFPTNWRTQNLWN